VSARLACCALAAAAVIVALVLPTTAQQKSDFLVNGVVDDVCGSAPCHTDNYG
jgi:hypothetical protein